MADSQQSTQVPAAQMVSMPVADAMPVDDPGNALKRAAPEDNGSLGPEAKQARLEDTAAEGAPSAVDLLPQPAVAHPGTVEQNTTATMPVLAPVEAVPVPQQSVQAPAVLATTPAVGHPTATPAAAPSSIPTAASTAPTTLPSAVEAVVVGAVTPAAAAPAAAAPQVQTKAEDVQPKQEAGEYQGRGGRSGGRGGRGRGRGRGGENRSYSNTEEGQEPTGDASRFKLPADVVLKQEIPLPRRMASCVIGIKGTTVSRLRRDSGAKIHVRPGVGQAELDQVVEIEGSIEAVVTCIRLVDELVRAEDPNYKMTPKVEVTSKFYVLPEMIGPAIIGKAGTHAKHIRERTGVRIEVIPPADNATRQHIVLHGTAERVREAYHLLLGNIRKYGPSLPAGAIPTPLPFPNRPPTAAERASGGRGGRGGYGGRGGGAQPPPPPRGGAAAASRPSYRYDDYSAATAAAPYTYSAAAPGAAGYPAAAAPAAAAYAPPAGGYVAAAAPDPNAAALAAAAAGGQQMYILQDGVLKPLTVMYQQPGAAAAAPAVPTTAQMLQGMAGYGAAPAATAGQPAYAAAAPAAPASSGAGGHVFYQQSGGTYAYAPAPGAEASAQVAAPAAAAPAAGAWAVPVGGMATSQPGTAPAYASAGAAAPAYAPPAAQVPGAPAGVQYVQYAYQPQ